MSHLTKQDDTRHLFDSREKQGRGGANDTFADLSHLNQQNDPPADFDPNDLSVAGLIPKEKPKPKRRYNPPNLPTIMEETPRRIRQQDDDSKQPDDQKQPDESKRYDRSGNSIKVRLAKSRLRKTQPSPVLPAEVSRELDQNVRVTVNKRNARLYVNEFENTLHVNEVEFDDLFKENDHDIHKLSNSTIAGLLLTAIFSSVDQTQLIDSLYANANSQQTAIMDTILNNVPNVSQSPTRRQNNNLLRAKQWQQRVIEKHKATEKRLYNTLQIMARTLGNPRPGQGEGYLVRTYQGMMADYAFYIAVHSISSAFLTPEYMQRKREIRRMIQKIRNAHPDWSNRYDHVIQTHLNDAAAMINNLENLRKRLKGGIKISYIRTIGKYLHTITGSAFGTDEIIDNLITAQAKTIHLNEGGKEDIRQGSRRHKTRTPPSKPRSYSNPRSNDRPERSRHRRRRGKDDTDKPEPKSSTRKKRSKRDKK